MMHDKVNKKYLSKLYQCDVCLKKHSSHQHICLGNGEQRQSKSVKQQLQLLKYSSIVYPVVYAPPKDQNHLPHSNINVVPLSQQIRKVIFDNPSLLMDVYLEHCKKEARKKLKALAVHGPDVVEQFHHSLINYIVEWQPSL